MSEYFIKPTKKYFKISAQCYELSNSSFDKIVISARIIIMINGTAFSSTFGGPEKGRLMDKLSSLNITDGFANSDKAMHSTGDYIFSSRGYLLCLIDCH